MRLSLSMPPPLPFDVFASGSLVPILLDTSRPATVLGRVRAVVVDAVDRVLRARLASHVREEGFVRGQPAVTHGNPATPVVRERRIRRVKAPIAQRLPGSILWRSRAD